MVSTQFGVWLIFSFASLRASSHELLPPSAARELVKRTEHANRECRQAIDTRNEEIYRNLQKRYDPQVIFTPEGLNTSLCFLSPEQTEGPFVSLLLFMLTGVC